MKNIKENKIISRLIFYFLGLFVLTMGIAFSIKANLGVSPVSAVPYAATCVWGVEIGIATMIFQAVLVVIQILLLRKNYKWINCLQILVGILFGLLTSLSVYLMGFLPAASERWIQALYLIASLVLMSFGIFFYVNANIMHLPIEGLTTTIAKLINKKFHNVKIVVDCAMVIIAGAICLICIHGFGSIGIGTVVLAVLLGIFVGIWGRIMRKVKEKFLIPVVSEQNETEDVHSTEKKTENVSA